MQLLYCPLLSISSKLFGWRGRSSNSSNSEGGGEIGGRRPSHRNQSEGGRINASKLKPGSHGSTLRRSSALFPSSVR
ncbi:hypothetical protein EON65_06145 [archaeon]|nr:MAG: hypothetical protein EON65_06145 [archaeon]